MLNAIKMNEVEEERRGMYNQVKERSEKKKRVK
jgi:hypothetical protein